MRNQKKADEKTIKMLVILFFVAIIFSTFAIIIYETRSIIFDDDYSQTDLVFHTLIHGGCFETSGAFDSKKFTQSTLNECFKFIDKDIVFRTKIIGESSYLYVQNRKEEFESKMSSCSPQVHCVTQQFPVAFKQDGSIEYLEVQLINS